MKIISFTYFFFFIIINFKSLIILFIYKIDTYASSTYYEYTYDSLYNNFLVFSVKFSEKTLLCKKSLSNKINLDISEAICLWATSRVRSPSSRRNRNRPRGARGARRGGWVGSRKKWKMLSRFVTTSRTRIINPRYVVPCTLYLLVITAPSLSLLSRSTTSSWAKDGGRVAARGVAARGREHTYDFFSLPSPFNPPTPSFPFRPKGKMFPPCYRSGQIPFRRRLPLVCRVHTWRLNACG